MEKLTKNGVCHDLPVSPYLYWAIYNGQKITFYFSSSFYQKKFKEKIRENRDYYNGSLSKRFGVHVNLHLLPDMKLYRSVEKRGFYVTYEDLNQPLNKEDFKTWQEVEIFGEVLRKKS